MGQTIPEDAGIVKGMAQPEIVEHREEGKIEGVLVEHPDAQARGLGRGVAVDRTPVQHNLAAGPAGVAGQDFHQGGFAGAVFAQNAVNRSGADRQGDAVVGPHRSVVLVDVPEGDLHGRFGAVYLALLGPSIPSSNCSMYQICLSVATSPSFRNTLPS